MSNLSIVLNNRKKPDGAIWKFFGHVLLVAVTFGLWFWVWLYMLWSKMKHNEDVFRQLELMAAVEDGKMSARHNATFPPLM